ncbi:MAG: ATP-binding protein [Eggerthellaceae bacterium]|nr:ATP-binding protein [Eggerthellaceae bacterium]
MAKTNPYTLTFGKEPTQLIARAKHSHQIIESFVDEPSTQQVYMITGVRGSGKTVFMTETAHTLGAEKDWVVIELNPEKDLLTSLASKLSSENELARLFQDAEINLSFFGFGLEVKGVSPVTEIETAIEKMLKSLKRKGKRLLVCIDEVTNTSQMKAFAAAFQIFLRQDLPIYLLMTGLFENINALQNEKSLTFLYRAPKIHLGPLNIGTISEDYQAVLKLNKEEGLALAKLTKGYSFAFQVLGYFTWENPDDSQASQQLARQYLDEYAYEKIWAELSRKDRKILYGIAQIKSGSIKEIRELLEMSTNEFNPYRQRLMRKGIISGDERGYVRILLPFFDQYALANYDPI